MKTLLQIVQQFTAVAGLTIPVSVVGSTDTQIIQILALLNEGLDELAVKKWPQAETEATFTSTSVESQGKIDTIAPGFEELIPDTFWNLTNKLPAIGSMSPAETQVLKVWGTPSAMVTFRQVGDELHFIPAIASGIQFRFEYRSKYLVKSSLGVAKQYFTADSDVPVLPDNLLISDLRWRWRMEKGLPYAEQMRTSQILLANALTSSAAKRDINMSGGCKDARPGIVVPLGSWQS